MNKFDLNIGLNVGYIEPKIQEGATLHWINQFFGRIGLSVDIKEGLGGDWGTERVAVVRGETNLTIPQMRRELADLCRILRQDAIAYRYEGIGDIVFSEAYKGEFYEFNNDYYIL